VALAWLGCFVEGVALPPPKIERPSGLSTFTEVKRLNTEKK
jgi:hypothetical protein